MVMFLTVSVGDAYENAVAVVTLGFPPAAAEAG
jgi:hypothetical protein